jgi:hypothetical protein
MLKYLCPEDKSLLDQWSSQFSSREQWPLHDVDPGDISCLLASMLNWRLDPGGLRYTGWVQNIAGITHWTLQDNINLEEIYEGKYKLVPAIGWYVSYITYFSSRYKKIGSNYASLENGMSVRSEQEAEYETMLQFSSTSAQRQHLVQFVRSLIGRFEQLEAL